MVRDLEVHLTLHVNTPNLLDLKRRATSGLVGPPLPPIEVSVIIHFCKTG